MDLIPQQPPPEQAAGSSAQREFARRSQTREHRIRTQHPRLGGLLLALTDDPSSTRVWAQGAAGERAVAATLAELEGTHLVALHDRRIPRSRANIDHLAVAATGVWVIDAKTHQGKLEVRRSGALLGPRVKHLFINGRNQDRLLEGLAKQVEAVRLSLTELHAEIPVRGALCFVGTELPWFGDSIDGVPLVGRRGLATLLKKEGDLTADDRAAVGDYLNRKLVPA